MTEHDKLKMTKHIRFEISGFLDYIETHGYCIAEETRNNELIPSIKTNEQLILEYFDISKAKLAEELDEEFELITPK